MQVNTSRLIFLILFVYVPFKAHSQLLFENCGQESASIIDEYGLACAEEVLTSTSALCESPETPCGMIQKAILKGNNPTECQKSLFESIAEFDDGMKRKYVEVIVF